MISSFTGLTPTAAIVSNENAKNCKETNEKIMNIKHADHC